MKILEKLLQIKKIMYNWLLNWPPLFIKNGCSRLKYVLSKQQELDADLKAVQQINYTGNLYRAENRTIFLYTKK